MNIEFRFGQSMRTRSILMLMLCFVAASALVISLANAAASAQRKGAKAKPKIAAKTARPQKSPRADTTPAKNEAGVKSQTAQANGSSFRAELPEWLQEWQTPAGEGGAIWKRQKGKRADQPDKAFEYFMQKRLPEGETELPFERYVEAMEAMQQMPLHSTADNRLAPSRAELQGLSPEQQRLGTWTWLGPGNIGGRTRAIVFHPQDANVIYAAGVSGGVWKTTDAGQAWRPISDLIANIPVSALALEPGNPNVIYAGTGEGFVIGSQNGVNITGGHRGLGIYKSMDAGGTWTRLAQTANTDFYYVNKLAISTNSPQRVYAATETGVWRSLDGGATWTRVHNPGTTGGCLDLAIRTDQTADHVFAACGTRAQSRIFRNTDAGGAGLWTEALVDPGAGRTALAIAPSNQNVIYALSTAFTGAFSNSLHAVHRSINGGEPGSWTARVRNTDPNKINRAILSDMGAATATDCKIGGADSVFGQGFYDLAIAVDPADENRVWAGGIDLARSDDGGANWGIAGFAYAYVSSSLVYGRPNQVHPDQHTIVFPPQYNGTTNQQMFVGNDGGLWKTENARAAVGTGPTGACNPANSAVRFVPLNNNYGVTQFYHGAVAPDGKSYFGGTQDNGTLRGTDDGGPNKWQSILLADGGYAAIDFRTPTTLYASTQGAGFRRSTDNGATFSSATLGLGFNGLLFITPLAMDQSDPRRLYTGGEPVWRTNTGMSTWTNLGSIRAVTATTGTMSAVAVAPTDANHVMWGLTDGSIVRSTRALALGPSNPLSAAVERVTRPRTNAFVSWLAYDPNDKNIAYATYSTFGGAHVYRTTNGGESWAAIDGTGATALPDIPAHCIVVDTSNPARLYVGTDLGVFVSTDTGATWAVENTGFANVVTESLALNVAGGVTSLYAFTHGRGVYKVAANMSGCNFDLARSGSAVALGGGDLTVDVNVAPGGCNWRAESNAPWITVQPGAGGSASGTVGLNVQANRAIGERIGTVSIAGRSFTVTQEGLSDLDSPTLRITTPTTPTINTTAGAVNVAGTAADNVQIRSVLWRSDRGVSGLAAGTANWTIAGLPLVAGQNVITVNASDAAGNVSNTATLIVNSRPASVLTTAAGSGVVGFDRDNAQATSSALTRPWRISFDGTGNLYIADDLGHRVRKVAPNGVITTVAGSGVAGFSGDGGPATAARLNFPSQAVIDRDGNLYIADYGNSRVRKVTAATGVISTVAGTGAAGFSGDGGPAAAAQLNLPDSVTIGKDGDLYISDTVNHRVRKVALATGVITTVAGTGTAGFSGDGGAATAAALSGPVDVAFDGAGDMYIAASGNNRVRKVTVATGVITTVAGNGQTGFNGDGVTALNASIGSPQSLAFDGANNLYINDRGNVRIRRVNASDQIISTIAGGALGFSPDGSGAVGARLAPIGIAIDPGGRLFIADTTNARVRTIVSAVAGDLTPPAVQLTTPTNSPALTTANNPIALSGTASDGSGVVSVRWSNDRGGSGQANGTTAWEVPVVGLQPGLNNLTITAWDASGNAGAAQLAVSYTAAQVVVTVAGSGAIGDRGDNGPGTAAQLFQPRGVAVDSTGNIYVADTQNRRVRRIAPNGVITAFAGTGSIGSSGDGGPAVDATLNFPNVVIVDKANNVYISDQLTNRVRKVTPDGKISTIAGTGEGFGGFAGDGGPATQAQLNGQVGLAVDNDGNLFIADRLSHRIRRIDARTGIITTVAGSGQVGFAGDGGPATQADLNQPAGVAVDASGNLYITDLGNLRIRRVSAADGRMSTIAGAGVAGFSGDGGPAAGALINITYPATITVDAAGDVYFADRANHRIRKITLGTGVITTVAGTGVAAFNGDGTAPAGTSLSFPTSVAFDAMGNLIIADSGNNRVRRVRPAAGLRTVASVSAASFSTTLGLASEAIASAFGMNLAGATASATSVPLPVTLAGTTVRVRDSLSVERLAPLFFVSAEQINYLVPSGTANGLATVTVTNGAGEISTGTVNISNVAPGLFSANFTGTGLAAAVVLRRTAAGVDSYEPVVRFDAATNRFVAVPIDLGPEGDQVFLIPYGTGFRGHSGLANVRAIIGGVNAPALYAGAAPGLPGADQANLRLDRGLAGRGDVEVILIVDGKTSNALHVVLK